MTAQWGKWNSALWAVREVRTPQGCWSTLPYLLLLSQGDSRRGQAGTAKYGKAGCQISALGQSRGDCCYWINLWELSFSDCWQFPFWSVLGLPVSWDEALGVPGCWKQSSPALPSAPAKQCPPSTGHSIPGINPFGMWPLLKYFAKTRAFDLTFFFLTFLLICFYFILLLFKCRVLKWRLGVLEKSCTVSCAPEPEVSFEVDLLSEMKLEIPALTWWVFLW